MLKQRAESVNVNPKNKEIAAHERSLRASEAHFLCSASVFSCLREDSTSIERVVNNFSYRRCVWVHVHSIARAQMANDALGCYLQRYSS